MCFELFFCEKCKLCFSSFSPCVDGQFQHNVLMTVLVPLGCLCLFGHVCGGGLHENDLYRLRSMDI